MKNKKRTNAKPGNAVSTINNNKRVYISGDNGWTYVPSHKSAKKVDKIPANNIGTFASSFAALYVEDNDISDDAIVSDAEEGVEEGAVGVEEGAVGVDEGAEANRTWANVVSHGKKLINMSNAELKTSLGIVDGEKWSGEIS